MGHTGRCTPGTATRSSKQPLIGDNLLFYPDLQLSAASPSHLAGAAAVFFRVKVMFPSRAMGRTRGWAGSCRRSGVKGKQPQLRFHRLGFGGSAGARSPLLLLPAARSCPAHAPGRLPGRLGTHSTWANRGWPGWWHALPHKHPPCHSQTCFQAQLSMETRSTGVLLASCRLWHRVRTGCEQQVKQQSHKLGAWSVRSFRVGESGGCKYLLRFWN